ncbi:MAG: hypothetical protein CM15mP123_08750 [Gammaproteobacteria bacterium]|nr:MAG: hypothetical protein CM15mP123_08750 [Gammaproteobacteria bacterium]
MNAYFEEISKGLERGEEIKIPKLGNFVVKHKNSRPGRNPKTGEPYKISDRNVVPLEHKKNLESHCKIANRSKQLTRSKILHDGRGKRDFICKRPHFEILGKIF